MFTTLADRVAALEAQVQNLQQQNHDFRQLIDHSGEIFWTVDIQQRRMLYISGGFERLYDFASEIQYADPYAFLQVVAPADLPIVEEALARQRQGAPSEIEYRVIHRNGSIHWIHERGVPVFDDNGRHVRTAGIAVEITERKFNQESLLQQRQLLRTIIDLLPDSVYAKDALGRKTLANQIDVRYMGLTRESDALGKLDADTYPPEIAAQLKKVETQVLLEGKSVINQEEWLVVNGEQICLLTSQVPLRGAAGEVTGLVGVGRDITKFKAAQVALKELNRTLEDRIAERTHALQREVEMRRRKEEELALSEQRLRQVVDLVPHMIFAKDIDGRYILANKACADSLGVTVEQLLGKRDAEVNPWPEEAARFYAEDVQVITQNGALHISEESIHFYDGSEHIMQTLKIPFVAAGHEKPAMLGVGIEITEVKLAEAKLKAYTDELQQANTALRGAARFKDEFMAMMSHELRTPLSSILGLAEALQLTMYGPLTDRQQRSLKLIESSGRELLGLIDNLLDLSRIEAGQFHLHDDQFDAVSISKSAVDLSTDAANAKGQSIQFETNCERLMVQGDQRRWQQILLNLVGNAIKFTPQSGKIGVKLEADNANRRVHVHVWDRGIGINQEDLSRLFRPFSQLDSTLTRQFPGTGLGLALAKRLVELQGGEISVHSEPGEGSTFTVSMPYSQTQGEL
ncbi:MAG: PAS domain-containing protein [Caldilineaceae bacterium]|nr:PAS domain-containing protein [Caldilineaceae bacterium]